MLATLFVIYLIFNFPIQNVESSPLSSLINHWASNPTIKRSDISNEEEAFCGLETEIQNDAKRESTKDEQQAFEQMLFIKIGEKQAQLYLEFEAFNSTFTFALEPDTTILADGYKEVVYDGSNFIMSRSKENAENALAVCNLRSRDRVINARFSLCESKSIFGRILLDGYDYKIHPMIGGNDIEREYHHVNNDMIALTSPHTIRRKESTQNIGKRTPSRTIKAVVVSDQRRVDWWGQSTASDTLNIASLASQYYLIGNFPTNYLQISLVGQVIFSSTLDQDSAILYPADSTNPQEIDPDGLLSSFRSWTNNHRATLSQIFRNVSIDQVSLFTGTRLRRPIIGYANVGVMCLQFGAVAIIATQTTSSVARNAYIYAHEIGHNLGFRHTPLSGNIMSASVSSNLPLVWDTYTINEWNNVKNGLTCLDIMSESAPVLLCGNGIIDQDAGEECDASYRNDICCDSNCKIKEECLCSNILQCCISGQIAATNTSCRPPTQECDIEDSCTGNSGTCIDRKKTPGTSCTDPYGFTSTCGSGGCLVSRNASCSILGAPSAHPNDIMCDRLNCGDVWYPGLLPPDGSPCGPAENRFSRWCYNITCIDVTYSWQSGIWSSVCIDTIQYRDIWCSTNLLPLVVSDEFCDSSTKPAEFRTCPEDFPRVIHTTDLTTGAITGSTSNLGTTGITGTSETDTSSVSTGMETTTTFDSSSTDSTTITGDDTSSATATYTTGITGTSETSSVSNGMTTLDATSADLTSSYSTTITSEDTSSSTTTDMATTSSGTTSHTGGITSESLISSGSKSVYSIIAWFSSAFLLII